MPKIILRLQMWHGGFQIFKLLNWFKKLSLELKKQKELVLTQEKMKIKETE